MLRARELGIVHGLLLTALTFTTAQAANPVLSSLSDPRAVAMGSAGVAFGSGVLASDANPALLSRAQAGQVEVLGPVSKGFHEDSQLWQIGAVWPSSPNRPYLPAIGVAYRDYDFATELLVRTAFEPEGTTSVLKHNTKVASLFLAMPLGNMASIGADLRRADAEGITGWYGDIGAVIGRELYATDGRRVTGTLGIAARQLGEDLRREVTTTDFTGPGVFERVGVVAAPVRAEMAWGATLGVAVEEFSFTTALELIDPLERGTGGELHEHLGFELDYARRVAVRAGLVNDDTFESEFTYGAGVRVPVASRLAVGVDYAREPALPLYGVIETHAPEASHFLALRVEYDPR